MRSRTSPFRERLILQLLNVKNMGETGIVDKHLLLSTEERDGNNRKKGRRCLECYKAAIEIGGREEG